MASIDVRSVGKRFGKVTALEDVSFSVDDGEFFCLLGPSGAGKTTTLKIVAGLVEPESGTVHIDGQDVRDVEPTHRDVAMCFENYALYPQLNVFDNLASPLRSPRMRMPDAEARQRIQHTAALLGIDHLLERSVTQLSNGQRQRVALGRVLVRPARAYLLDEPLAHLDAKLRATMRAELKSISGGDTTTTVYVTHDYVEALSLADRIGVIRDGRILQVGTPTEVWSAPANAFVAQAFGKPRINLVPGTFVASDGGRTFAAADDAFQIPIPAVLGDDTDVQLGVRPRDLRLHIGAGEVPDGQVRVDGSVYVAEHLGRHSEVTVQIGRSRLSVVVPRAEASRLSPDDKVGVLMNPRTVHVFAAGAEGKRVTP
ncbi:MAG TPA: ABC transporter ATP-binding protein [Stackebrandtia sp.]|jgi:ABC-type sugar transport system ATPase subunit|uniref:ABC transporter ATP-binding protein n=1 Tax=Stackebrandtia sp. TaxID=2023065 RepID=UPI002D4F8E9F|nr:ABC transporter ATP-binding protein [Stackebrandtia sp.]HZE41909.1 ABC transporter ATP-binding protein [Stackebrandtia sp.]